MGAFSDTASEHTLGHDKHQNGDEGPEYTKFDAERFEELIAEFKERYSERRALIQEEIKPMKDRLIKILKEEKVKNQITSRMKDEESAVDSLRRRQKDRMDRSKLKEKLEELGESWTDYWEKNQIPERIDDHGPFQDLDALFNGLHDIGGIRIMVYLPNDVEKVVKRLENAPDMKCERVVQRGQQIAPDIFMLESHIAYRQKIKAPENVNHTNKTFLGYRATHVHMRPPDAKFVIEIQIQTMVMNAWSQVEHDLVYKPGVGPVLDYEREERELILDTINGIVMVGENALRQLGQTLVRKNLQQAESSTNKATNIYDIGSWITDHCDKLKGKSPLESNSQSLRYLGRLNEYLETGGEHTRGTIENLVEEVLNEGTEQNIFNHHLPLFMLRQKCISHPEKIPARPNTDNVRPENISRQIARFMALRVVHCLNVAASLEIGESFIRIMDKCVLPAQEKRPTLLDFLDILHPDHSRVDYESEALLCQFCDAFLNTEEFCAAVKSHGKSPAATALTELPLRIAETGRVAYPVFSKSEDESVEGAYSPDTGVIIPRTLCALLKDHENTHWIPDIYTVAKDWKDINEPTDKMVEYAQVRTNRAPENNRAIRLDIRTGECVDLIVEHPDRTEETIFMRNLVVETPHTRWILKYRARDRVHDIEFQADKMASRPRKHPGYFRSIRGDVTEGPKWSYFPGMPEQWEWRNRNDYSLSNERVIKGFQRKDAFQDLAHALLPTGATINRNESTTPSYSLQMGEAKFMLRLEKRYLILSKAGQGGGTETVEAAPVEDEAQPQST